MAFGPVQVGVDVAAAREDDAVQARDQGVHPAQPGSGGSITGTPPARSIARRYGAGRRAASRTQVPQRAGSR